MAKETNITWTRSTFNPWVGCTKVGPGCDHCYAEALDARKVFQGAVHFGAGVPRMRTSVQNWNQVLKWHRKAGEERTAGVPWNGRPGFWPVFCASLADIFDNETPQAWRRDLWDLIGKTDNLSWLLVTKRIGNVAKMVPQAWLESGFPKHVRLIVTVVNQDEADRDIEKLLALPCKNGISYEPALGPVDWSPWISHTSGEYAIDWIICGGESNQKGHNARQFDLDWARSTITQCKEANVPCFIKQLGSNVAPINIESGSVRERLWLKDRAGANIAEWPQDLRVQEFPL